MANRIKKGKAALPSPAGEVDASPPSPPLMPVAHTQETTMPMSGVDAPFGLGSMVAGSGAPWEPGAAPAAPTTPPADDLNWAQRGLQAALVPASKGTFAGRTVAQWQRLVQREEAFANQPAAVVLLTAWQAAELLDAHASDEEPVRAEARAIVSGHKRQPSAAALGLLRRNLAALQAHRPATYAALCRALDHTYGSAAAAALRGTEDAVELPQPNLVTPQAKLTAQSLASLSPPAGDAGPGWLAAAQDVVAGRDSKPQGAVLGALGLYLLRARRQDLPLYRRLITSLRATYGAAASDAVETLLAAGPFTWGPQPGGAAGWLRRPDDAPCDDAAVHAHWAGQVWPF